MGGSDCLFLLFRCETAIHWLTPVLGKSPPHCQPPDWGSAEPLTPTEDRRPFGPLSSVPLLLLSPLQLFQLVVFAASVSFVAVSRGAARFLMVIWVRRNHLTCCGSSSWLCLHFSLLTPLSPLFTPYLSTRCVNPLLSTLGNTLAPSSPLVLSLQIFVLD